jgi:hypothetical protein
MRAEQPMVEQDIFERIKAAKIRLRFDKVVLRLVGGLQAALTDVVPDGEAIIFTVTAPIRRSAKTATVLASLVRDNPAHGERRQIVHGNHVRIRRLTDVPLHTPKVLGFVHNPASDAGLILGIAEARLFEGSREAD